MAVDYNKHSAATRTYTEVLNLVKNVVIESKVVARDDVDTSIFLDLPVR